MRYNVVLGFCSAGYIHNIYSQMLKMQSKRRFLHNTEVQYIALFSVKVLSRMLFSCLKGRPLCYFHFSDGILFCVIFICPKVLSVVLFSLVQEFFFHAIC